MGYLEKHQSDDGAWLPLWFGNQLTENKTNPVYGTAKVCIYLGDCLGIATGQMRNLCSVSAKWLIKPRIIY